MQYDYISRTEGTRGGSQHNTSFALAPERSLGAARNLFEIVGARLDSILDGGEPSTEQSNYVTSKEVAILRVCIDYEESLRAHRVCPLGSLGKMVFLGTPFLRNWHEAQPLKIGGPTSGLDSLPLETSSQHISGCEARTLGWIKRNALLLAHHRIHADLISR